MAHAPITAAMEALLSARDPEALRPVLHPACRWNSCYGADAVILTMRSMLDHGAGPESWTVTAWADRVTVSVAGSFDGTPMSVDLAMLVADGQVTHIVDAPDADAAQTVEAPTLDPASSDPASSDPANAETNRLRSLAAVLPVRDVSTAMAHYELLGFVTNNYDDGYGYADRDDISLHLARVDRLDPLTNTSAAYLFVDDAAALHSAWITSGATGRFHAPEPTPYGLLEGAHIDPDGNLLRYGSHLG